MILMTSTPKKESEFKTPKIEGRCMRCRTQVQIQNLVIGKNARGVNTASGNCGTCNTKVFRILPKTK